METFSPCCKRLRRFLVHNERISCDGKDLVKDKQGKHVGREGNTHHGPDGEGKRCIIPRLGVFAESPHVPDAVHGGNNPEERSECRKQKAESVGGKPYVKPGKDLERGSR